MPKKQVDSKKIVIFLLVVLLLGAMGYIGYGFYMTGKVVQQQNLLVEGAQYGRQQAVLQIAQLAAPPTCQQVPLTIGNQTINVFAIECLNQ